MLEQIARDVDFKSITEQSLLSPTGTLLPGIYEITLKGAGGGATEAGEAGRGGKGTDGSLTYKRYVIPELK